ncbi:MAG: ABC transporter permease [Gemmatimonadota bacterium]
MPTLQGILARVRAVFRKHSTERELDDEIRIHIDMETEKNVREGMSRLEARRRAMISFGGVEAIKEAHRDGRGSRWAEELLADVRYASRSLRRSPGLAFAAIVTLALGIGANTAIFSVVNAVILRPLPFPDSNRLMMLSEENPEKGWHHNVVAGANYLDWRERVKSFEDVAAYSGWGYSNRTLTGEGEPRLIRATDVTGNFFSVLGVRAASGRTFRAEETWRNGTRIGVISNRLWRDALGSTPNIEGRIIELDGTPLQVVGVMPDGFSFPSERIDIWRPMAWDPSSRADVSFRRAHGLRAIARLGSGVTERQAAAEFQSVVTQLQREFPLTNKVMGADMTALQSFLIGDVRLPLLIVQGAAALLLLLACANVGNLLLVQAAGREREAALRLTLGAGRFRLTRQAITESLVLSTLGGLAGLALGWLGTRALAALQPAGMLPVPDVGMDGHVLAYATLITTASGLLFGIAPTLWNRDRVPAEVVKEGGRTGSAGRRVRRWGEGLAAAEVAVAVLLAVGAGLLVRSFWRLQQVDPGFEANGVLATGLSLPGKKYDTNRKLLAFFDEWQARVQAVPGVKGVALAFLPPLTSVPWTGDFHIAGQPADQFGTEAAHELITPEYFRVLRVPLKAGRPFTKDDREGAAPVIMINDALARRYFAGQNPVGQQITFGKFVDSTSVWRTIVGVAGDVRQSSLAVASQIQIFEPVAQDPSNYMTLFARTDLDPGSLGPAVRRIVHDLDPNLAITTMDVLDDLKAASIAQQRFIMMLLIVFAVTGVMLAVVGVYGVMAQLARRRSREMGIRIALGARAAEVQWLVVRRGLEILGLALGIGMGGALVATRAMQQLLFEIGPGDPATFLAVAAILTGVALAASWLPAVRASRADPAGVLRAE